MLQQNEVITLLLGLGVFVFIVANWSERKSIKTFPILFLSYFILLLAWLLTNLESFIWSDTLNFVEHLCYMFSAILLVYWYWRLLSNTKEI